MSIPPLGRDEWFVVTEAVDLGGDVLTLVHLRAVCRGTRGVVSERTHDVNLSHLSTRLNQKQLCEALNITVEEARMLPHTVEWKRMCYGSYETYWFTMSQALPALLHALGGWSKLAERLNARNARKRKRADLELRREEASAERRRQLNFWIEKTRPFGTSIDSVDAWIESLTERGGATPQCDRTLSAFLGNTLKAPLFESACSAAAAFHATQQRKIAHQEAEKQKD